MLLSKIGISAALSTAFLAAADPLSVHNIYVSLAEISAVIATVSGATWIVSRKLAHLESLHEISAAERAMMKEQINQLAKSIEHLPCRREPEDCPPKLRRH